MVNETVKPGRFKKYLGKVFGKTKGERTFQIVNYVLFLLFGFIMLYPFIYVIKVSLENIRLIDGVATKVYNFTAYGLVLANKKIYSAFFLTIFVVLVHTALHLALTFIAAYPLSKKHFKGRNVLLFFVLFTMLFSGGLIPSYILITQVLGWMDNLLVYIIPGVMTGFNIIIVKNFLQGIPESLEESAKLEGANDMQILFRIYIPLSLPIAATVALWAGTTG